MTLAALASHAAEKWPVPDAVIRLGIAALVGRTARDLARLGPDAAQIFAAGMDARAIAEFTAAANAQHYELPPEFFALVLGPQRKYSSCRYRSGETLACAEQRALAETCAHAELADGQDILELGCGWGSLSLWMAEHFPASQITAVSNARPQRGFIEAEAGRRGLKNLRVVTADMNVFDPAAAFDRVVSVEMFEHMSNWRALLTRVRIWLRPQGKLFLHVFSHHSTPYRYETNDPDDWIAQFFFSGGIMPSHDLVRQFPDLFEVEADWRWDGTDYERTALDWLANYDANAAEIAPILRQVYGNAAPLWTRRWRIFFLATAGLFGHAGGQVWGVSHHRLIPVSAPNG